MLKLRYPGIVPILFIICATALLLTMGVWQLQRMAWKEGLLAQIETGINAPVATSVTGDVAYRKAQLTGRFMEEQSLHFVGTKSGGFVFYTPLKLSSGEGVVLVNRGWFAGHEAPKAEKAVVTIEGVLRPFRDKRRFSPNNAPEKNIWFVENSAEMNAATGLTLAPYILETGTLPALRNDHLGYAITWFTLAVIGLVMFGIYFRKVR
jgi:surfeit locus 1 family protein